MPIRGHFEKWVTEECYITYDMDFWFVPSDPVCCQLVISKQGDDSASWQSGTTGV